MQELGCNYGAKCKFAHGKQELIEKPSTNSKYKSKLCTSFHTQMFCPYGNRCLFKHDERTIGQIASSYYNILLQFPELKPIICDRAPRLPVFVDLTQGSIEDCNGSDNAFGEEERSHTKILDVCNDYGLKTKQNTHIQKFAVRRCMANADYFA